MKMMSKKAQATIELGILSTILLMVLGFLFQQAFIINQQQRLQMYTQREALRLAKKQSRRVSLTAVRFVPSPNFFGGIEPVPLVASASVEWNPRIEWISQSLKDEQPEGKPEHTAEVSYIQIGEDMMKREKFIKIPLMKVEITTNPSRGGQERRVKDWQSVSFLDQIIEEDRDSSLTREHEERPFYIKNLSREETRFNRRFKYYTLLPGNYSESLERIRKDIEEGNKLSEEMNRIAEGEGFENVRVEVKLLEVPQGLMIEKKAEMIREKEWKIRK